MELYRDWPVNGRRFGGRVLLLVRAADYSRTIYTPIIKYYLIIKSMTKID